MEVAQKDPAIAGGNGAVIFRLSTHPSELLLRHAQKKLMLRFGKNDELFAALAPPTGRNGDPVFFVDGVPELAGEEFLGLRVVVHPPADGCAISIHFSPLLTTLHARGQSKLMPLPAFHRP